MVTKRICSAINRRFGIFLSISGRFPSLELRRLSSFNSKNIFFQVSTSKTDSNKFESKQCPSTSFQENQWIC